MENHQMKNVTTQTGVSEAIDTKTDGVTLKITNTPGAALPSTGGPGTSTLYLFGILITGIAGGSFMMRRRKSNTI